MPDAPISREQLAVIQSSYTKAMGSKLPKVHQPSTFADSANISADASNCVKQMQMAGVLLGKKSNLFDPQGIVTRGEACPALRRFV